MIPALILFCSAALSPDACTEQTAFDAVSREVSPFECAVGTLNAQMELVADPRGAEGIFVKLICANRSAEGKTDHGNQ
ncbi:MAG: hypothetical protein WDN46_22445 [Methylocella sp.]